MGQWALLCSYLLQRQRYGYLPFSLPTRTINKLELGDYLHVHTHCVYTCNDILMEINSISHWLTCYGYETETQMCKGLLPFSKAEKIKFFSLFWNRITLPYSIFQWRFSLKNKKGLYNWGNVLLKSTALQ